MRASPSALADSDDRGLVNFIPASNVWCFLVLLIGALSAALAFPGVLPWRDSRPLRDVHQIDAGLFQARFSGRLGKAEETGQFIELYRGESLLLSGTVPKASLVSGGTPGMHISKSGVIFRVRSDKNEAFVGEAEAEYRLRILGSAPPWLSLALGGVALVAAALVFLSGRRHGAGKLANPLKLTGVGFLAISVIGFLAPHELPPVSYEIPPSSVWRAEGGGLRSVVPIPSVLLPGKARSGWQPARLVLGDETIASGTRATPLSSEAGDGWQFALDGRLLRMTPPAGQSWDATQPIRLLIPPAPSWLFCGWMGALGACALGLGLRFCGQAGQTVVRILASGIFFIGAAAGGLLWGFGLRGILPHASFAAAAIAAFSHRKPIWLLLGVTACAAPPVLSVLSSWQDFRTDEYLLGGVIPFSDAAGYFSAGWENFSGRLMNEWCARRPLYPAYLAGLLSICGGDLKAALLAQAAVSSLCLALAALIVLDKVGALPSLFLIFCSTLFLQRFSPLCMTENLGVTSGLLGAGALVLWATGRKSGADAWSNAIPFSIAIGAMTFALLVRPGVMGVLPVFALAGMRFAPFASPFSLIKDNWRLVLATVGAVVLCAALEAVARKSLVQPGNNGSMVNFAHTFYGLATGQTWMEASAMFGNDYARINSAAWEEIRNDPSRILISVPRAWVAAFGPDGLFAFAGATFAQLSLAAFFLIGTLAGAGSIIKDRIARLLLFSLLAILMSIPLAPPWDAGYGRFYAATVPLFALISGLGVVRVYRWMARLPGVKPSDNSAPTVHGDRNYYFPLLSACMAVVLMLILSSFIRVTGLGEAEIAPAHGCRYVAGAVVMVPTKEQGAKRLSQWRSSVRALPGYPNLREILAALPDGARVGQMEFARKSQKSVMLAIEDSIEAGWGGQIEKLDGVKLMRSSRQFRDAH